MSDQILVAIISASGAVIVGLSAVALNVYCMGKAFDTLTSQLGGIRQEFTGIRQDIKDLTGAVNGLNKRLTKVQIKLGIQP